jgi:hypothetical protein
VAGVEVNEIPEWYPLRTIWFDYLQEECSEKQLREWAHRLDHFPKSKKQLGKYHLYDVQEVVEWVHFWRRVTVGMGSKTLRSNNA